MSHAELRRIVKRCAAGLPDGQDDYELVQHAAAESTAAFWGAWASSELHWFHPTLR